MAKTACGFIRSDLYWSRSHSSPWQLESLETFTSHSRSWWAASRLLSGRLRLSSFSALVGMQSLCWRGACGGQSSKKRPFCLGSAAAEHHTAEHRQGCGGHDDRCGPAEEFERRPRRKATH